LSAKLREREEKILNALELLSIESSKGTLIVVEGKNDVETLKHLGIQGRILQAKTGGKSMVDLFCQLEESGATEVILLLDFDRRGREWTAALMEHLERANIKPNLTFWRQLAKYAGKELKDVEGIESYLQTLKEKIGEA
jgi:2,5-diamino-6-(ribosylamino)-4(3H)-pyrimidinone 5'-phosphate reductase